MADIALTEHGPVSAHEAAHHHPGERVYVKVAAVLLVITIIEVVIYYIQWMHDHKVIGPALLALSAVKFATVVGFFMHLKFDDRRLTVIFGGALAIALATIIALYVLLQHHGINYTTTGMMP
jgi:cytochrome c oxidase subunit IV